jgi:hypothetical protein
MGPRHKPQQAGLLATTSPSLDHVTRDAAAAPCPRPCPAGHLFAGAVSGAASRTATAPLETLRLAAMAGGVPAGARMDLMAAEIVRSHGWRALYKGGWWGEGCGAWRLVGGGWAVWVWGVEGLWVCGWGRASGRGGAE